jgi:hypothetical protein
MFTKLCCLIHKKVFVVVKLQLSLQELAPFSIYKLKIVILISEKSEAVFLVVCDPSMNEL